MFLPWKSIGFFCIEWDDHVFIFSLLPIKVVYFIDWFSYVELALPYLNKAHMVIVIIILICWQIWFASFLLQIFASIFIRDIGDSFLFL